MPENAKSTDEDEDSQNAVRCFSLLLLLFSFLRKCKNLKFYLNPSRSLFGLNGTLNAGFNLILPIQRQLFTG